MGVQTGASLPRVQTRKELMDYLEDQISAPAGGDGGMQGRGRPRGLRSYVVEARGGLAPSGGEGGTAWEMDGTGIGEIKILRVHGSGGGGWPPSSLQT